MWYAKMYFSEGREIFQYDSLGMQGVPDVQKEFPFLESLLAFQELDCAEVTPILQSITDNWSRFIAEDDRDALENFKRKLGRLASIHIYFRLLYVHCRYRQSAMYIQNDRGSAEDAQILDELRQLPEQLPRYQQQIQRFFELVLNVDSAGREPQAQAAKNYTYDMPKDPGLFCFRPIPLSFEPVEPGRCSPVLYSSSIRDMIDYKGYLMEFFKPKTVNLRIQAMNKYLNFLHKDRLRLKAVKVQQKNFLENVISNADYNFLKKQLKKDDNMEWYFVVWYLAATGARVSELIQIKIEHVELGYFDLYTKGGKLRRLYIPKKLRTETLEWLEETHRSSGYLFLNRYGVRITTRGISQQLKNYADKYGLDKKVVYPHSFRHRYAKNFLEKYNDIALLADLMGHESIETTRIYLRRTASEQQALVDKIVTW